MENVNQDQGNPNFFCDILESVLPARTKRVITIISLCGKIINKLKIDKEYLSLLNTYMLLSREEDALKLPIYFSDTIWHHVPAKALVDEIDEEKIHKVALEIVESIPPWLRYARDIVIVNDVESLLKFNHAFKVTH